MKRIYFPYIHIESNAFLFAGKVLLAICALLAAAQPASAKWGEKVPNRQYADLKPWHLGFSVGFHMQDVTFYHNGMTTENGERWQMEVPSFSPGFCVNVLGDLSLHRYLNLRLSPGLYFGSKTVEMRDYDGQGREIQDVKSSYIVLPLDLKISGDRLHNTRPYLTVGAMGAFDISKKRSDPLVFNSGDAFLTVGLGCDFYLPFFKLNPEIKFCFGLTDILKHDRPDLVDDPETIKFTQSLSKVKSNMVVVSFYFE